MLRKWITHPWEMRRWLKNPGDMWRIARKEWENRGYEQREGHPYYGPIPPDSWPTPIPEGSGCVYRCFGCGELGYHGTHIDGGCQTCDCHGGVVVAYFGKSEEE